MANNQYIQPVFLVLLSGFLFFNSVRLSTCQSIARCVQNEKEALLKIKASVTDPSGRLSSWTGEDCCKWEGVICDNSTGKVVQLKLRSPEIPDSFTDNGTTYQLEGEISPSVLDLKHLNYLDLSLNNFRGSRIPNFLGSLEKLRYLNLSGASFAGNIPPSFGNLSSLQILDLNTFYYSSLESDDVEWLSRLSSLQYLNLEGVDLSKAGSSWVQATNMLPSLSELHLPACGLFEFPPLSVVNFSSLLFLDLSSNDFNSSIPQWLLNISKLAHLDLSANNLQGNIPDAFANMTSLRELDLSENSLIGGQIPKDLGSLCNLWDLDLSGNDLDGEIIEFVDRLSKCANSSLESLDLGQNNLGGFLPNSLGQLENLKILQLWGNLFRGSIPESIGNLSSLRELYLHNNLMDGTIPKSLGKLSHLVVLDISGNPWIGLVTEVHFSKLKNLKELHIAKYSLAPRLTLVFNVSPEWVPPFKLRYMRLRSCQLGPKFPAWLRNQNELHTFILRNAQISDTIPEWFWQLDLSVYELDLGYNQISGRVPNSLKFLPQSTVYLNWNLFSGPFPLWSSNVSALYLSNNSFSGPIPSDIGDRMPMLTDMDISHNLLNGTIPLSIGRLSSLTTLSISNNNLTGHIPEFWNGLPFLYAVDVSNNSLSSEIPSSMGSLRYLRFLMLSNNRLSGEIPSTLQNCTTIRTLDLGYNKLSGNIPTWLGKSTSLWILRLRSNLFFGDIPSQVCSLSSLHILDLAHNNLSKSIPSCIGNLTGMALDMDSERYEGNVLVTTKGTEYLYESTLYLVNSIDLGYNSLSGEIPDLTNLSGLVILNLSTNHLTGKIPDSIGSLGRLETLDLSKNQLSGAIPPSLSSSTFLAHLNLSFNNLSGEIPSNNQFQSLNDPSIYAGNPELCGSPLSNKCNKDLGTSDFTEGDDEDGDDFDKLLFYSSIAVGFIVGFWGVCGSLALKKSWRLAYFRFFDKVKDRLILLVIQRE
ncbi:LRRNT 2 domain-containing protein [Citrus sinensis]|nr:receptor-like protein EIX2 [Citrus sinensis]KAH9743554.1 LRRNT 2 domain-containing protein [Citrus sinensis]